VRCFVTPVMSRGRVGLYFRLAWLGIIGSGWFLGGVTEVTTDTTDRNQ